MNRLPPITIKNKRLCVALNNIRAKCNITTSDEAVFIQWLKDGLDSIRQRNDLESGDRLLWNQGACQVLNEVLQSLQTAKEVVKNG